MIDILIAILIFGLIIAIHEFGHFAVAKLCKIKVNKFAIGMGPKLIKFTKGETEYSLRLLPIGGFCAMEGEDESSDDKRAFNNKAVWQRMLVVVAGAVMNVFLGFVLLIILTCMLTKIPSMEIDEFHRTLDADGKIVEYNAESYESGLKQGDIIYSMNGLRIFTDTDLAYKLSSTNEEEFDVVVIRDGEKVEIENVKFGDNKNGGRLDFYLVGLEKNPLNVISYAAKDTISTARLIWLSLFDLITGKYGANELSGPVGIVSTIGEAASIGETIKEKVMSLMNLTIFITINVGVCNMLPIPALDGGRFIFLIVEAIRRKPIKPEHEGYVHLAGMILLFALMIFATYNDILRLIKG